jgi:hypothetical protein
MMADNSPSPAQAMTLEELQAEAELRILDILQRFERLPQDKGGLFELLVVIGYNFYQAIYKMLRTKLPFYLARGLK